MAQGFSPLLETAAYRERPSRQTVIMSRVPFSYVTSTLSVDETGRSTALYTKGEAGTELGCSLGKGPGFDPQAAQKTEKKREPGEENGKRERAFPLAGGSSVFGADAELLPALPFLDPSLILLTGWPQESQAARWETTLKILGCWC